MGSETAHNGLRFMKMHGLGNDFVVIDGRRREVVVDADLARQLGDRHRGVGFDQLALVVKSDVADAGLVFFNSDGSESAACGNATRCIGRWLMDEAGKDELSLKTERGVLAVERSGELTRVNMGAPSVAWDEIPLSEQCDTDHLPIEGDPIATSMGNPHCTFFVDDALAVELEARGPEIEHHPLFPQRTNVQFVSVVGPDHLRMRVWERGAGVTLASGSSSCAVCVAAHRRGIAGREITLDCDGGRLWVEWREDGVWMTGPTTHVFDGVLV